MIRLLIELVFIFFLIWLVRRCWDVLAAPSRRQPTTAPPADARIEPMVRDPECGTHLPKGSALLAHVDGEWLHFCSRECREAWLARMHQHN